MYGLWEIIDELACIKYTIWNGLMRPIWLCDYVWTSGESSLWFVNVKICLNTLIMNCVWD